MHTSTKPVVGTGKFQWNAGGWFGSSFGSSAWMLVVTYYLVANSQSTVAMVPAIGFLVIMIAALLLWSRRDRIYPYAAMMTILGLMAFVIPFVWMVVQNYGSLQSRAAMNWPNSQWSTVFVFVLVPAMMVWFQYVERLAVSQNCTLRQDSNTVA